MGWTPKPIQMLYLVNLLGRGGEDWLADLKDLRAPLRKELTRNGFLEEEKKERNKLYITLTEKGWRWIIENPAHEISRRAQCGNILQEILTGTVLFAERKNIALAEIFGKVADKTEENEIELGDVKQMIRSAYIKISGGEWHVRVRLTEMRKHLPDIPRKVLDDTFLEIQKNGGLVLYSLDDPLEIGPEDKAAAIDVAGDKRHILYMGD